MKFLSRILLSGLVVMFLAWLLPGVNVKEGYLYALIVAAVIGVLNAFVRPVLVFLTLPATIVSLGLFILVINAAIIMLADYFLVEKFMVTNFWWALLFSILLSAINTFINNILKGDKKVIKTKSNGKSKVIVIEK
jgi:putative membrane protein